MNVVKSQVQFCVFVLVVSLFLSTKTKTNALRDSCLQVATRVHLISRLHSFES
jgi:hypothetical protein